MDFAFIGGSMGAVVGEKKSKELITQLKQLAFCDDFKIRWRRMMEAAYSLMQLAKTSVN
jgi:acetyl-CoA carboxylase carboxyl transferase subunit beta